jgi:hypothetical protein
LTGLVEYDGRKLREVQGNKHDDFADEKLEAAKKKKSFRSDGKLVKLVIEMAFLPDHKDRAV